MEPEQLAQWVATFVGIASLLDAVIPQSDNPLRKLLSAIAINFGNSQKITKEPKA